jgi:predicted HTH domain antitoxin
MIDESKWYQKRSFYKYRLSILKVQITEERKKRVIDLYFNQHKSYAEIAQIEKISPRDIHAIIKEEIARRQKHKDQEQSAEAYRLFSEGKTTIEVASALNLPASKVSKLFREYWKLRGLDKLNTIYKETNGKIWTFLKLYKELIKKNGMSIMQVVNVVEIAIHKLPYMETLYRQAKEEAEKIQRIIQRLTNEIEDRKHKISILDKIAFSCEQECKRKHQEIQELIAQKDRVEKWITNILNGEGYSKLKAIVKENVKAVLLDNKKLISILFVALIQTIKADPQMVNLIQNMPSTNDGEQYKDNNNITKYLELYKDRILNLGEKNYENLVEAFTKNAIHIATSASSSTNPTLSLPQSSSTFPNSVDQIDIYGIEESENYHNSKGDIADSFNNSSIFNLEYLSANVYT